MEQKEQLLGGWYPENDVMAVIDSPEEGGKALAELREAGFHAEDVLLATGGEAVDRMDASGRHCGLLAHFVRWLEGFLTDEGVLGREYEAAAQAGHSIIAVHTHDAAEIARAREVLARHGAHHVYHFGHWALTRVSG